MRGADWLALTLIAAALSGCDGSVGDLGDGPETRVAVESWRAGGQLELGGVLLGFPPSGGAVAPEGTIAVTDPARATILILEPDGTLDLEFGGRGFAPGEFQQINRVGFVGDTLLWVTDNRSSWITLYDLRNPDSPWTVGRAGQHVPATPWSVQAGWILEDGSVLGEARGGERASGAGDTPAIPVVKWSPEGELQVIDIVENVAPRFRDVRQEDGRYMSMDQPIAGAPLMGVARGGKWFFVLDRTPASSEAGEMLVTRYGLDGRRISRITIPYLAHQVNEAALEWLRGQAEALERQLPSHMTIDAEDILGATWIPDRLPPARDALADESGFWIFREMTSPGLWERYDLDGNLIFEVLLPQGFRGLAGDSTSLFGWLPDSLDVPELRRYEMVSAPPPRASAGTSASQPARRSLRLVLCNG